MQIGTERRALGWILKRKDVRRYYPKTEDSSISILLRNMKINFGRNI